MQKGESHYCEISVKKKEINIQKLIKANKMIFTSILGQKLYFKFQKFVTLTKNHLN